jgi:hypothetical protein
MSLFKRKAQPAPAPTTAPPAAAPRRTIDPAAYGFVPAAAVSKDFAGPWPDRDVIDGLVAAQDWHGMSTLIAAHPLASERRFAAIDRLGAAAADDDVWLRQWLREDPKDATALTISATSMVDVAWKIRTGHRAKDVSQEQWDGFFRVLRGIPDICQRASESSPTDPAPWIALLSVGLGLQWSNDEYRALWREISARAPHSYAATNRAWNYWRPRWYGSLELLEEFVEGAIAAAPPGSILTATRIHMLYDEFRPSEDPARAAFHHGDRMRQALDHGLADAAAADPAHFKLPLLRHWLAWELFQSGRHRESIEQFRALGGFAGAPPWTKWNNAAVKFCGTRTAAVLAWEDAGRPG